jgi:hypothetical protein
MGHGMGRCQIQTTPNSFQTSSFLLLRVRSLKYTHKILQLLFIDFFSCGLFFCSLTFTPFEFPVCTADGSVFDLMLVSFSFLLIFCWCQCWILMMMICFFFLFCIKAHNSVHKEVWEASCYRSSVKAGWSYTTQFP